MRTEVGSNFLKSAKSLCALLLGSLVFSYAQANISNYPVPFIRLCSYLLRDSVIPNEVVPVAWKTLKFNLATKPRTGWITRGIPENEAETILEHSIKVHQAAIIFSEKFPPGFGRHKTAFMALFHDTPEYKVKDYTPKCGISPDEKFCLEETALRQLAAQLGVEGQVLLDLWLEFEEGKTAESLLVKQLDKLDPAVQALRYKRLGYTVDEFFPYALSKLQDPRLKEILKRLWTEPMGIGEDPYHRYYQLLGEK